VIRLLTRGRRATTGSRRHSPRTIGSTSAFQRIAQLNQWIIQFAAQQGVAVVDFHAVLAATNGENYGAGLTFYGIHPSPTGYALMTPPAEQALKAVVAAPLRKDSSYNLCCRRHLLDQPQLHAQRR
jgi:hypothetical protein